MAYELTPEMVSSITDVERAFSTTRLLPPMDEIPEEFFSDENIYTKISNAMIFQQNMPNGVVLFDKGYEEADMVKCVEAHAESYSPKHEHKVAGVAYMISLMCTIDEVK
ncbi:hypothetical protein [Vibrio alginolyticus]|uniref:hypothetical protein n=1 Tax=Vibrio alginolyticus TaxID=663 RepID=UPI0006CAA090|nr:hypothetical protein [Vibrio alginolyticus]KPM97654.1 hypothetical protein AOG25_14260 [Vibrio alginolyticus]CAH7372944.1 conserved hypothetical protein [Vibrio chagasii]